MFLFWRKCCHPEYSSYRRIHIKPMGQRDVQRASFGPSNTSAGLTLSYFVVCVWVLKNTNWPVVRWMSINSSNLCQTLEKRLKADHTLGLLRMTTTSSNGKTIKRSNPGKTIERRPYPWSTSNDHHIIQWQKNDKTVERSTYPCLLRKEIHTLGFFGSSNPPIVVAPWQGSMFERIPYPWTSSFPDVTCATHTINYL